MVDVVGAGDIPQAKAREQPARVQASETALKTCLHEILLLQIPCITHRRVHVADVNLVRTGKHAFRDRVVA